MNKFIAFNKLLLLGFWLVFTVNVFMPFAGAVDQWVMLIGLAMLIVHLIEFFVMRKRLQSHGLSGLMNFVWVMLFGLFYWKPLLRD
ncbi:putative membrane protein [Gammaproteobacteria bacterium MOLA455]|nr:putative membrane protein [Gammaproteobacteria bacterium MOLA455]